MKLENTGPMMPESEVDALELNTGSTVLDSAGAELVTASLELELPVGSNGIELDGASVELEVEVSVLLGIGDAVDGAKVLEATTLRVSLAEKSLVVVA